MHTYPIIEASAYKTKAPALTKHIYNYTNKKILNNNRITQIKHWQNKFIIFIIYLLVIVVVSQTKTKMKQTLNAEDFMLLFTRRPKPHTSTLNTDAAGLKQGSVL